VSVGPEELFGQREIVDFLTKAQPENFQKSLVVGPSEKWVLGLEEVGLSLSALWLRNGVPTAAYETFTAIRTEKGLAFLGKQEATKSY